MARLGPIWSDVCAQVLAERHRDVLVEALGREKARTVSDDEAAPALWRLLQQGQDEGHDIVTLLREAAVSRELDSAESLAKVLHHRVERRLAGRVPERAVLPERELRGSYVERTPEPDGLATPSSLVGTDGRLDYARRVAAAMDRRVETLGERMAEERPDWAVAALGEVPTDPDERGAWTRRAGLVEAYREQYVSAGGYGDVADPIGFAPSRTRSPERYYDWRLADAALGQPDRTRDVARLSEADLRQAVETWAARKSAAPAHVGDELRRARRELRRGRPSWSAAGPFPGTARVGQQQPRSIGLRTCGARSTTWSGPRRLATSGGTRPKTSGRWRSRPTRSSPGGSPRATSTPAPHCSASPRRCWLR